MDRIWPPYGQQIAQPELTREYMLKTFREQQAASMLFQQSKN